MEFESLIDRTMVALLLRCILLELKSEGSYLKFDQPSEVTFSGISTRMPVTKSCPSCKCIRKMICTSCDHVLCKHKPEDTKRWTLREPVLPIRLQ